MVTMVTLNLKKTATISQVEWSYPTHRHVLGKVGGRGAGWMGSAAKQP